jgi:hypothetical protein
MNPPICKLCETRHWLDEEHKPGPALDKVRKVGADVLRNTVTKRNNVTEPLTNNVTPVPALSDGGEEGKLAGAYTSSLHVPPPSEGPVASEGSSPPSPSVGRPKKHKTNAERQRAYRERSRGCD